MRLVALQISSFKLKFIFLVVYSMRKLRFEVTSKAFRFSINEALLIENTFGFINFFCNHHL